jgi:hypothetical protein
MMIYFVNNSKRQYVYAGEAEGESVTEIIAAAGWNGFNDNIIMVTDVERYQNRGYRDVDEEIEVEDLETDSSESGSELNTSEEFDSFMRDLRRKPSEETLTDLSTKDILSLP